MERILAPSTASPALRCECALLLSGAAVFADDPDRFTALYERGRQPLAVPSLRDIP